MRPPLTSLVLYLLAATALAGRHGASSGSGGLVRRQIPADERFHNGPSLQARGPATRRSLRRRMIPVPPSELGAMERATGSGQLADPLQVIPTPQVPPKPLSKLKERINVSDTVCRAVHLVVVVPTAIRDADDGSPTHA